MQTPDRQSPTAIQRCLQNGLEGHGYRPHHVGSCILRPAGLEADCALRKACPASNSHSHNRLRKRQRRKATLTDLQRISLASSAAGIGTPTSDCLVIPDPDSASVSPPRAQFHSLPRLTDSKDQGLITALLSCTFSID